MSEIDRGDESAGQDGFGTLARAGWIRMRRVLRERFSLRDDKADDAEIESRIRDGVELRGATPWILIFAIFVASVGLDVNSTAVIIGAMLISPLMGPIMGAGLGVAVYDFELVKRSLLNLAIAAGISLAVSASYFSLSPLHQAHSELLARTTPTLWDVLIALFGGFAGIVGVTRREKSNVIPGVAIATALMPPVCTAGFGLANGEWSFVGGALYLFLINCVFIGLATVVGIRALHMHQHRFQDRMVEKRVKTILTLVAICTALPSAWLAVQLVRDEMFKSRAQAFVAREFVLAKSQIVDTRIDPKKREIDLSLVGEPVEASVLAAIEGRLASADLEGARIVLRQMGENRLDLGALRSSLLADLLRESRETLRQRDARIEELGAELAARNAASADADGIVQELRRLFPEVGEAFCGEGAAFDSAAGTRRTRYLEVATAKRLSDADRRRIAEWFKVRAKTDSVQVRFFGTR